MEDKLEKTRKFIESKLKGYTFVDYCEEYRFDFFADNEDFNERFNYGDNWKLLNYDRTRDFLKDIANAITIGSNIIIFIYGPRNMGKSEIAQRIMIEYLKMFYAIKEQNVEKYIGFSDGEMAKIFPKMKPGDIATRDESPHTSGEGAITTKKNLENICNITRGFQISFVFINPYLIQQEGIDYYLECAGKNIEYRTIRCLLYDRRHLLRGVLYVRLHDDEAFRKEYLKKKKANIKRLMANAGGTYVGIDTDKLKEDAIALFEYCYKRNVDTKINIETQLINYNDQFDDIEANKRIAGTNNYIEKLVQNVYNALNGEYSILDDYLESKQLEELSEKAGPKNPTKTQETKIEFHETISFPDFCYRNIPDEKVARIARSLARGDSYRIILDNNKENKDLSYNFIRETSTLLRQQGYKFRLDYLFEKWFALKLGVPKDKLDEYVAGVEHIPDLIWEGEIYSLKFRYDNLSNRLTFSQSKDFSPEYKEAKKQNKSYHAVLMNAKWGQELVIKKLDPNTDPDLIKFKKPSKIKRLVPS